MECKFSKSRYRDEGAVRFDGQEILKSKESELQIFDFIIHKDGKNEKDVNHSIKAKSLKWSDQLLRNNIFIQRMELCFLI